jgi:hypothetical protein
LSSSPNQETEIFDEDGSQFTGKGFEADIKRLIVSFLEAVDGNYVVEDAETQDEDGAAETETETEAAIEIEADVEIEEGEE